MKSARKEAAQGRRRQKPELKISARMDPYATATEVDALG